MMRMPGDAVLDIAIMWLESNEGDGPEGEACKSVAAWLTQEMHERYLRRAAREGGVPVARLRRKLAERAEQ